MSEIIEIKFEAKEEYMEAINGSKAPVFIGELTSSADTGKGTSYIGKTVKFTTLDMKSIGENPVVYSYIEQVNDIEISNYPGDPERVKLLEKQQKEVDERKKGYRDFFEKKGCKVFYGIIKNFELIG